MAITIPLLLFAGTCALAAWALNREQTQPASRAHATQSLAARDELPAEKPNGRSRFYLLHNPAAGRNNTSLVNRVVEELRTRGANVDVHELSTDLPPSSALVDRYDAVVVSGGDGSIRSVATAYTTSIALGVIPNGTGNVLAEELELPRRAGDIAELLIHGPAHQIQGGTVRGEPFLLMFGAGFDGEIVKRISRATLRSMGKLAYVAPVLGALMTRPYLFEIDTDGVKSLASWVLVSNAAHYAGRFRLTDKTNILEPGMVVVVSRATTRRERIAELLRLAVGIFPRTPTIEIRSVTRAEIRMPSVAAQADGEPLLTGPCVIERGGFETKIIAPSRYPGHATL